jgi:putative ABC transport system substrate-binding protein
MEARPIDSREAATLERALAAFAREPNGGIVVPPSVLAWIHREVILKATAQYRLPAVYSRRLFVVAGGLISYGAVTADLYVSVAGYVDRILKGEKPADLPVQAPTRYATVLNLKTAKALGLTVPDIVLLRADEVIE